MKINALLQFCKKTCAVGIWLLLPSSQLVADIWPQFGGPAGDFSFPTAAIWSKDKVPSIAWRRTLGEGLSSLVCDDRVIYVTYLEPLTEADRELPEHERNHTEVVAAIAIDDGRTIWEYRWDAGWQEDQEAFGGKSRAPQATPLLHGSKLVVVGFTGKLHCLDRRDGSALWSADLVDRFAATPVQFGFSSSPIVHDDHLIILAGGKEGGLVCLNLSDGERIWNVPCGEASYATPVILHCDGKHQVVCVTREDVFAVGADDGAELWRYDFPKPGLTNVPTPLVLEDGRIAISGQGVGGTQELLIERSRDSDAWRVEEGWSSRSQFFYCNWVESKGRIIGCTGDLLEALDAESGQRLGRWRGFRDANLIRSADQFLVFDGKGALSVLVDSDACLEVVDRYQVLVERCWSPVTVSGTNVFCRGGEEIVCLRWDSAGKPDGSQNDRRALKQLAIANAKLAFENNQYDQPDVIGRITAAFESGGPEAAWQAYLAMREAKQLELADRKLLATMAVEQGLEEFATNILDHAAEDFPADESIPQLKAQMNKQEETPPNKTTRVGQNGLLYIDVGIRNTGWKTVHAVVRGPKKHPFSYGIPFRPKQVRRENWPVGTKLYRSNNEVEGEVLLELTKNDAGKTLEIKSE